MPIFLPRDVMMSLPAWCWIELCKFALGYEHSLDSCTLLQFLLQCFLHFGKKEFLIFARWDICFHTRATGSPIRLFIQSVDIVCILSCSAQLYNLEHHHSSYHHQEKPHSCSQQGCGAKFTTKVYTHIRKQRTTILLKVVCCLSLNKIYVNEKTPQALG